jgi:hypothetical protein
MANRAAAKDCRPSPQKALTPGDKYDCFFKVIDFSTCSSGVEDRGECLHSRLLDSYYRTIPLQPEHTIRLVLDGRHRRIRLHRDASEAQPSTYPKCSSLLKGSHVHHTPSPNPLYTSPAVINDSFRYHHLPTLRKLGQLDGYARWYGMHCFASHIDGCPSISQRLHPLQTTFERSDAYFAVCRNDEGLLTGKSLEKAIGTALMTKI